MSTVAAVAVSQLWVRSLSPVADLAPPLEVRPGATCAVPAAVPNWWEVLMGSLAGVRAFGERFLGGEDLSVRMLKSPTGCPIIGRLHALVLVVLVGLGTCGAALWFPMPMPEACSGFMLKLAGAAVTAKPVSPCACLLGLTNAFAVVELTTTGLFAAIALATVGPPKNGLVAAWLAVAKATVPSLRPEPATLWMGPT